MPNRRVVVVGGGASGTLLAAELLRGASPLEVILVEPRSDLGRGVAYSTPLAVHGLNVRAARMSARVDEPIVTLPVDYQKQPLLR